MRLNSASEISFTSGILRSALRLRSFHPAGGPLSMLRRSCSDLGLYLLDMAILLFLKAWIYWGLLIMTKEYLNHAGVAIAECNKAT